MGHKHSSEECKPTEVNANTEARATQAKTLYNQYVPTPIAAFNKAPAVTPAAQRRAIPYGAAHTQPIPVVDQSTVVLSRDMPNVHGTDADVDAVVDAVQIDLTN